MQLDMQAMTAVGQGLPRLQRAPAVALPQLAVAVDTHWTIRRRSRMSSCCCSSIRLSLSLVMVVAAMTLRNATPVHAAIGVWPSEFHAQQMPVTGGTQYVRVGGRARRSCCCTDSATPATCGSRSPTCWSRTTRSSCPICAAWACRRIPKADTRRSRRRAISPAILDQLGRQRRCSGHPRHRQHGRLRASRRNIPRGSRDGWSWTRRCRARRTGTSS